MDETLGDSLIPTESMTLEITSVPVMYGSIAGGDRYFSEVIYGQLWLISTVDKKRKAMVTATKMLEQLPFQGYPTEEAQALSFPRNGETATPTPVEEATYELALQLLKGRDAETEQRQLFVKSRKFGRITTDFDHTMAGQEHVIAGIPSLEAWKRIRPFLAPNLTLNLRRES